MSVNYSALSLDKLRKEQVKLEKAISVKEDQEKKEAMANLVAMAEKSGIDLADLASAGGAVRKPRKVAAATATAAKPVATRSKKKAGAKRGKVPPKYRNPANADQTWTGRGKQPVWVREHVENGGSLESITI